MVEKKVTPEKRMELARYIREENLGNRLKLRQRESILYGKEPQAPLFDQGTFSRAEELSGFGVPTGETKTYGTAAGSFKYRMAVAALLFAGFLLCDTRESKIMSYSTNDIHEMIGEDSFHLYDGDGNAVMEELVKFLD